MQDLNPIPFPVVVANCVAWVGYSIVNKDPYVFMANDPGLLLGLFYTLSAYGYADAKVRSTATDHAASDNSALESQTVHAFACIDNASACCNHA